MVDMTFEPEMRELLAKMKGKTFKSFECRLIEEWGYIASPLRINLGSFAVDLECWFKEVPGWKELDPYDWPTCLTCSEAELGSAFFPERKSIAEYLVGERITGVEIVNDRIEMDGEPDGSVDVALVIRTKSCAYTFSRDIWFNYVMQYREGDVSEVPYTVEKCAADWAEGTDYAPVLPTVTRTTFAL
ncbi:MAG: hypothetical protein IJ111_11425 [Eggerthellaceae bacterium]|nr:hypothetical protein [Eggerthellaceae bacterium]